MLLADGINPHWECVCDTGVDKQVHLPGCDAGRRWIGLENDVAPPAPVIVDAAGNKLMSAKRLKRKKPAKGRPRQAGSPEHTLLMTFYFTRPMNIQRWRMIKAPVGWKKCPTSAQKQKDYKSVRFQCNNLAHTLTPDAVQELRAMLCMALEEVF